MRAIHWICAWVTYIKCNWSNSGKMQSLPLAGRLPQQRIGHCVIVRLYIIKILYDPVWIEQKSDRHLLNIITRNGDACLSRFNYIFAMLIFVFRWRHDIKTVPGSPLDQILNVWWMTVINSGRGREVKPVRSEISFWGNVGDWSVGSWNVLSAELLTW